MSQRNILIAGSVSKVLQLQELEWMACWRKRLLKRALIAHQHMSNCQPELLQKASLALIQMVPFSKLDSVSQTYHKRATRLGEALSQAGFNLITANGGHFIMASHPKLAYQPLIEQAIFLP